MSTVLTDTPEAKAAADKLAADKVIADKAAADKVIADKAAADKAAADAMTPEQKAAAEKAATDKAAADKKAADDAADAAKTKLKPEEYKLTLAQDSLLDDNVVVRIATIASERGLTNEQAQGIVLGIESDISIERNERVTKWNTEITADKDLGGDNLVATQKHIKAAMDWLSPGPDSVLRKMLHTTGFGSNPEIVRAFVKIGKAIAEDKPIGQGSGDGDAPPETLADALYRKKKT